MSVGRTYLSLEASKQVDEEWMSHRVGNLEDPLLRQQRFDLVSGDDVTLLERLDGKVLARVAVLGQDHFAEVSTAEHAQKAEVVHAHAGEVGRAARLVSAVAVLSHAARPSDHLRLETSTPLLTDVPPLDSTVLRLLS